MSLSMAPLLMHSHDVPAIVRAELEAAYAATPERRDEHLLTAARMLSWMVPLDCDDALELVGLPVDTAPSYGPSVGAGRSENRSSWRTCTGS